MKKIINVLLCIVLAASLFSGFAFADERPENGWYITDEYVTESDGNKYPLTYYHRDGKYVTGWQKIDGEWYYFHDYGAMACADHVDGYYVGPDGRIKTNYWRERLKCDIYSDSNGLVISYTPYEPARWEYYGADGKRVYGWNKINGEWYYFYDGSYRNGGPTPAGELAANIFIDINNKWYLLGSDGTIQTGWYESDGTETGEYGKTYYLTENGAKTSQWHKDEETGNWHYFKSNSDMAKDEWVQVKTKWYLFDENGIMLTGEQERDGNSYLLSDSGAMYTGWKQLDDGKWIYYKADGAMAKDEWVMVKTQWYLFDAEGLMRTGLLERYDHTYYFDDSGSMATGWKKLDGVWYYFRPADHANGPAGSMVKDSWVLSGNKWYYIGEDGTMVTGTKEIYSHNSRTYDVYYFNDSGAMQTGWHHVDSDWRYFRPYASDNGPQGSMAKSVWVPAGDKWYYTDKYGAMVLGWKDINGERYYFSPESENYGQMVTGTQVIDGVTYVFDDDGALIS